MTHLLDLKKLNLENISALHHVGILLGSLWQLAPSPYPMRHSSITSEKCEISTVLEIIRGLRIVNNVFYSCMMMSSSSDSKSC